MMKYPVMEHFYSVQGEGKHTGTPAYFIRLGGCDVGCVWCDVKESWDASIHPQLTVEDLVDVVSSTPAQIVVITGGEPAMYDLAPLCDSLHKASLMVHIETSGVYELKGDFDWITFSPKKFKPPLLEVAKQANELKVIVFNKSDFSWAEDHAKTVAQDCLKYLQPEWSRVEQTQQMIFEYILKDPSWRISLQTHKYLGVD